MLYLFVLAGIAVAIGSIFFERFLLRRASVAVSQDANIASSENEIQKNEVKGQNGNSVGSKGKKTSRRKISLICVKGKYLIATLLTAIMFVLRYFSASRAINDAVGLDSSPLAPWLTAISALFNWFTVSAIIILILYPFFDFKNINNLVKFYATPIFLVDLILIIPEIRLFALFGEAKLTLSSIAMAMELGSSLALCGAAWVRDRNIKLSKSEIVNLLLSILPVVIAALPPYILQLLFGTGNPNLFIKDLTPEHRLFLYFAFIIPICIYFGLRNRSKEVIRFSMLYISIVTMLSYSTNYTFESVLNPLSWPLHLCNTAMFIIPLCLIFKWDKLFYFTYFINVMGAFLAMAMPNYGDATNIISFRMLQFWINHYCAFFMPLLIVALKIFPRPKFKQFMYSMVGFAIYFALILIVNGWFSNYGSVDYFFLNSDFVADKLGNWAEKTRLIKWEFDIGNLHFIYYPLYQALFFIVYVGIAFGMWFIYEQFFVIADFHYDMMLRNRKFKQDKYALLSYLNGRDKTEPMYTDQTDKLILENFSKRYGSSNVYAVKNANLEVHAGEIFGFLGPNGAGKSTIIKSIVGIQPITSGTIKVCGYDVEKQSVEAKRQIGYVPDHYALYERLTGREYINYIADIYDVDKAERDERIEKYVKLFELEGAIDNSMRTYSHGMKQKITIMAALVHNPKLWILDEPLTGLDPNSIYQVKECMKNHASQGNIVFFSSHIIDVVERICDRITIIKKGKILCTKNVSDFVDGTLEEFYLKTIEETEVEREEIEADNDQSGGIKVKHHKKANKITK